MSYVDPATFDVPADFTGIPSAWGRAVNADIQLFNAQIAARPAVTHMFTGAMTWGSAPAAGANLVEVCGEGIPMTNGAGFWTVQFGYTYTTGFSAVISSNDASSDITIMLVHLHAANGINGFATLNGAALPNASIRIGYRILGA